MNKKRIQRVTLVLLTAGTMAPAQLLAAENTVVSRFSGIRSAVPTGLTSYFNNVWNSGKTALENPLEVLWRKPSEHAALLGTAAVGVAGTGLLATWLVSRYRANQAELARQDILLNKTSSRIADTTPDEVLILNISDCRNHVNRLFAPAENANADQEELKQKTGVIARSTEKVDAGSPLETTLSWVRDFAARMNLVEADIRIDRERLNSFFDKQGEFILREGENLQEMRFRAEEIRLRCADNKARMDSMMDELQRKTHDIESAYEYVRRHATSIAISSSEAGANSLATSSAMGSGSLGSGMWEAMPMPTEIALPVVCHQNLLTELQDDWNNTINDSNLRRDQVKNHRRLAREATDASVFQKHTRIAEAIESLQLQNISIQTWQIAAQRLCDRIAESHPGLHRQVIDFNEEVWKSALRGAGLVAALHGDNHFIRTLFEDDTNPAPSRNIEWLKKQFIADICAYIRCFGDFVEGMCVINSPQLLNYLISLKFDINCLGFNSQEAQDAGVKFGPDLRPEKKKYNRFTDPRQNAHFAKYAQFYNIETTHYTIPFTYNNVTLPYDHGILEIIQLGDTGRFGLKWKTDSALGVAKSKATENKNDRKERIPTEVRNHYTVLVNAVYPRSDQEQEKAEVLRTFEARGLSQVAEHLASENAFRRAITVPMVFEDAKIARALAFLNEEKNQYDTILSRIGREFYINFYRPLADDEAASSNAQEADSTATPISTELPDELLAYILRELFGIDAATKAINGIVIPKATETWGQFGGRAAFATKGFAQDAVAVAGPVLWNTGAAVGQAALQIGAAASTWLNRNPEASSSGAASSAPIDNNSPLPLTPAFSSQPVAQSQGWAAWGRSFFGRN